LPRGARPNRWLRLSAVIAIAAFLIVLITEATPSRTGEKLDLEPGAQIRRAAAREYLKFYEAAQAVLTGIVIIAGFVICWGILREDERP
jgi:hypothetical protein